MNIQSLLKQSSGLKGPLKAGAEKEAQAANTSLDLGMEFAELLGAEGAEGENLLAIDGQKPQMLSEEQLAILNAQGSKEVIVDGKANTEEMPQLLGAAKKGMTPEEIKVILSNESSVGLNQDQPMSQRPNGINKDLGKILQHNKQEQVAPETAVGEVPPANVNKVWGKVNREEVAVVAGAKVGQGAMVQKAEVKSADMMLSTPDQVLFTQRGPQVSSLMAKQKAIQGFEQFSSEETPFVKARSSSAKGHSAHETVGQEIKGNELLQAATVSPLAVMGVEGLSTSNALTQNHVPVLDLSQVKVDQTNGAEKLMGQISDYISINRLQMNPKLEIQFKHDELGQIQLNVEKTGPKGEDMVNIMISTQSPEARDFFINNQEKLVQHLNTAGIEVADFSMESMPSSMARNESSSDSSSESPSSQSNSQSSSHKSSGSEAQQKREDSERRKNLWNLYKDQKELA